MPLLLSAQEFSLRLEKNNKKLISNYFGLQKPINTICMICNKEHYFAFASAALHSKSCRNCSGRKTDENQFKEKLKNIGYELISDFNGENNPVSIKCIMSGYIRNASRGKSVFINSGHMCCSGTAALTQKEVENALNKNNFIVTSKYIANSKPLSFYCKKCNKKYNVKQAFNALSRKHCDICDGHPNEKYTKEDVYNICRPFGITLEDKIYVSSIKYHNFKCSNGHISKKPFSELLRAFKKQSNGCKKCCKGASKNENLTNIYLKELLKNIEIIRQFKIVAKIENDKKIIRNKILVDFYFTFKNKEYIIEHNGSQHYSPRAFHKQTDEEVIKSFEKQQIRDKWLRNYCKKNNITLIEIDGRRNIGDKIKSFLIKKFKKLNIITCSLL